MPLRARVRSARRRSDAARRVGCDVRHRHVRGLLGRLPMSAALRIEGECVAIRPAVEDDYGYIHSTWMNSFARPAGMSAELYRTRQPELIKKLIASDSSKLMVACSEDVESTIFGWVCAEAGRNFIHYGYVRDSLRNQGIARSLVHAALGDYPKRIYVTHRFMNGKEGRHRFIYNPYLLQVLF